MRCEMLMLEVFFFFLHYLQYYLKKPLEWKCLVCMLFTGANTAFFILQTQWIVVMRVAELSPSSHLEPASQPATQPAGEPGSQSLLKGL